MNLIDIVKRLPWPHGAMVCVQDDQGTLSYRTGGQIIKTTVADIADNRDIEVVIRGEWVAAQIDMRRTVCAGV
jgi:hypothetical protein